MWHLLKLYVAAIREVARLALLMAVMGTAVVGVMLLIPGLSWFLGCYLVATFVPTLLSIFGINLPSFVALGSFISALIYLPALTWTATLFLFTASAVFGFIQIFDMLVKPKLGAGFSLQKILRNPWGRLEALRPILEKLPISYKDYLNFLNDATPGTEHYFEETLDLEEEEITALIARQNAAIAALPEEFKQLHNEIAARTYKEDDFGVLIEQKRATYLSYSSNLTLVQQNAFNTFLNAVLNLTHATCPVTREPLEATNQNDFLILEKRYQDKDGSWHVVPQNTTVFSKEIDGRDILLPFAKFQTNPENASGKKWVFVHPTTNDYVFSPRKHEEYTTQYRRYAYQTINGYPLSLQICEAMEAFNNSLNPVLASASSVTTNRTWPAAVSTSISGLSNLNMHASRLRNGSDASSQDLEHQYDEDVTRTRLEEHYGEIPAFN